MSRKHLVAPEVHRRPAIVARGLRSDVSGGSPATRTDSQCAVCGAMSFARCSTCSTFGLRVSLCDSECAYVHGVSSHPKATAAALSERSTSRDRIFRAVDRSVRADALSWRASHAASTGTVGVGGSSGTGEGGPSQDGGHLA